MFTRTNLGYSIARSGGFEIVSRTMGALPVLNTIMQRMKLNEVLDAYLPPPDGRSKITVSQGLLPLVRNILIEGPQKRVL